MSHLLTAGSGMATHSQANEVVKQAASRHIQPVNDKLAAVPLPPNGQSTKAVNMHTTRCCLVKYYLFSNLDRVFNEICIK